MATNAVIYSINKENRGMTSKENSIKLKELGFEGKYTHAWYMYTDRHSDMHSDHLERKENINIKTPSFPAYSAETLFDWLMDWRIAGRRDYKICGAWMSIWDKRLSYCNDFEYEGNLADFYAKPIIFILTEKEEVK